MSESGGSGTKTFTVDIGSGNYFLFEYNAYSMPDRFTVKTPAGAVLFLVKAGDSGCSCAECQQDTQPTLAGAGQKEIPTKGNTQVIVTVNGYCDSTQWDFTVGCAYISVK